MPWPGRSPRQRQYPGVWHTAQPWATTSGGTCEVSNFNKIFNKQCSGSGTTSIGIDPDSFLDPDLCMYHAKITNFNPF
jgi:hypothetical protein